MCFTAYLKEGESYRAFCVFQDRIGRKVLLEVLLSGLKQTCLLPKRLAQAGSASEMAISSSLSFSDLGGKHKRRYFSGDILLITKSKRLEMTGGVGFSNDAMNTGRSNRANRTSNHGKFKEGQKTYLAGSEPLKFKEVSEEDLQKIKSEIRENAKQDRIKTLIIGFVILVIFILAGLYFIF